MEDPPSIYAASYTVGALNTGTDNVASFSSRGPVTIDGSDRIKPDITASGTGIRSAITRPTASTRALAARQWRARISPVPWHCSGARDQSCVTIFLAVDSLERSGVISSLPTSAARRTRQTTFTGWGRVDIFAAVGPTPSPVPSCSPFPCFQPVTLREDFDGVTPPALPSGWVATNAQGPPPLWVTSNSGVPVPPADTPPNAAFIDDPAVVSDKRLDSRLFLLPPGDTDVNISAQLQS